MKNKKQPVLGIVPTFHDGNGTDGWSDDVKRVFLRRDYLRTLANVGALPIILSPDVDITEALKLCDGVIISGGADIDPKYYGEAPITPIPDHEPADRYEWESQLITACDEQQIPILGICYGMQRLNVHYGGSLIQDIPTMVGASVDHWQAEHPVLFTQNFLGIPEGSLRTVESRHHQAIARLADGATIAAKSEDGVIEAALIRSHYGMQWHPESDMTGVHVYRAFVEACMRYNE